MNQWQALHNATLHWRTGPYIPQPRLVQIKAPINPEETASNYNCQAGRQAIQVIHTEGSTDTDKVKVTTYNIEEKE